MYTEVFWDFLSLRRIISPNILMNFAAYANMRQNRKNKIKFLQIQMVSPRIDLVAKAFSSIPAVLPARYS